MKRIVVAGGSGFIGEPLVRRLLARGDDVAVLTRNPSKVHAGRAVVWNPPTQGSWSDDVANADVVINLAGENVGGGRWTAERKKRIMESRVAATSALVQAMSRKPDSKRTFISASATGFYGDRGDESLDESSTGGSGFLAEVTKRWEELARGAEPFARVVIIRFGVVLAKDGGALAKLLLPFRLGAGGPMGNGRQWMPWVDRDDILRIIEWSIDRDATRGTYNATAPNPARNHDFAQSLGRVLHRPAIIPTPAFALRLALDRKWPTRCSSARSAFCQGTRRTKDSSSPIPSWTPPSNTLCPVRMARYGRKRTRHSQMVQRRKRLRLHRA